MLGSTPQNYGYHVNSENSLLPDPLLPDPLLPDPLPRRPTYMKVDLDALTWNLQTISEQVKPAKVMAVVKSNAYGHGLVPCAKRLEEAGVDYLGVAFVEEGIQLRQAGIKTPTLVLSGIVGSQIKLFLDYDLDLYASSILKVNLIEEAAKASNKRARVHLKIDTGMERIGVRYYNSAKLFEAAIKCKNIDIVGVASHFATQELADQSFMKLQLERFNNSVSFFEKHSLPMPIRHIAASGAILRSRETHLDMVRPGLILYGVAPAEDLRNKIHVKPVMSFKSSVVYFKVVKANVGVSYGLSWKAPADTRVVTVPVGYGDGYPRRLSNVGHVLINGNSYPVVGKICMDQLMVDIGPEGVAYNGDEVVLVGTQGQKEIKVEDIVNKTDLIGHEFLVGINQRVPRRYSLP